MTSQEKAPDGGDTQQLGTAWWMVAVLFGLYVLSWVDRLIVSACYANEGPSMKRVRPAPMGRAFRIVKRTAHLTVRVSERQEAAAITDVAPVSASASEETEPAELTPSTKRAARKTPVKKRKRKKTGDAAGSRRASTTRRKTASKE